jgi:RNA recognition motif-containing protein
MTQPTNVSSLDPSSKLETTKDSTHQNDDDLNQKDPCNVFIKYLPPELTDSGLYSLFLRFGEIVSCKVMVDPITGHSLGYGYFVYSFSI